MIITIPIVLLVLIWKKLLSTEFKSKIRWWHWLVLIGLLFFLGWVKLASWQFSDAFKSIQDDRTLVINGVSNPLGITKLRNLYRLELAKDHGETEKGRFIGLAVVYAVDKETAAKVLATKGQYLAEVFKMSGKLEPYTGEPSTKYLKGSSRLLAPKERYRWRAVTEESRFGYDYNGVCRIKSLTELLSFSLGNNPRRYIKTHTLYPIYSWRNYNPSRLVNKLSPETYYFDIGAYIYIYDPVNLRYMKLVQRWHSGRNCVSKNYSINGETK